MVLAIVPVVMVVLGALVYGFAANPKLAEIGKLVMFAGLVAFAFSSAGRTLAF